MCRNFPAALADIVPQLRFRAQRSARQGRRGARALCSARSGCHRRPPVAKEMLFTARHLKADEALRAGRPGHVDEEVIAKLAVARFNGADYAEGRKAFAE